MAVTAESAALDAACIPEPAGKDGGARFFERLALALVLLPLLVSAVLLIVDYGSSFHAVSDSAINELRTRDIGHHAVLLGPYSRDGWNHPGPAMYYLLSIPYLLSGRNSIGVALGALLINGSAIVGMAVIARRRGGTPLFLFTLVGCALVVRALGADFIRDPWNPFITVLPFALVVLLSWAMTCGEAWALPVAVGVASFSVQTHVGYVPLAIPLVAWGAGWLLVIARRDRVDRSNAEASSRRAVVRAGAIAALVLAVMWLPPLIEQVTQSPGNLTKIVRYFRHPPAAAHTLAEGYRVVVSQFGRAPEWLVGAGKPNAFSGEPHSAVSAPIPLLLVPFVAAVIVLWRRRVFDGCRLAATVVVGLLFGVLAVARTSGPQYAYRLRWTWILAMLAFVVVAWAAWTLISTQDTQRRLRLVSVAAITALVVLSGLNSIYAGRAGFPEPPNAKRFAVLLPQVTARLPRGDGVVLIRPTSFGSSAFDSGLILALERKGIASRADGRNDRQTFGNHRSYHGGPIRATLYTAAGTNVDRMSAQRDLRLIAYWGDTSLRERLRLSAQGAHLKSEYLAKRLDGVTFLRKAQVLAARAGSAAAVFLKRPTRSS